MFVDFAAVAVVCWLLFFQEPRKRGELLVDILKFLYVAFRTEATQNVCFQPFI